MGKIKTYAEWQYVSKVQKGKLKYISHGSNFLMQVQTATW